MAPAQPSSKRVRLSDDVDVQVIETPTTSNSDSTPSQVAKARIEAAVALYPDAIKSLAIKLSKEYNSLKNKIRSQEKKIIRFDDDETLPGSAKIKFQLTAPADIMDSDEFKEQDKKIAEAIKIFEKTAKEAIQAVSKQRLTKDKDTCTTMSFAAVQQLCEIILLADNIAESEPPVMKFSWYITGKIESKLFEYTYSTRTIMQNKFKRNLDDDQGNEATDSVIYEEGEKLCFEPLHTRVCHIA